MPWKVQGEERRTPFFPEGQRDLLFRMKTASCFFFIGPAASPWLAAIAELAPDLEFCRELCQDQEFSCYQHGQADRDHQDGEEALQEFLAARVGEADTDPGQRHRCHDEGYPRREIHVSQ